MYLSDHNINTGLLLRDASDILSCSLPDRKPVSMKHDESVLLGEVTDRVNARIQAGETTKAAIEKNGEIGKIVHEVLMNSPALLPAYAQRISKRAARTDVARRSHDLKIRRNISKRFWSQFRSFKEILALCEVANRIQLEGILEWKMTDFDKKFAAPFAHSGTTGGAGTKCLLLNSLDARVLVICQEILELLTLGFTEAAASRARTLHEVTTIAAILAIGSKASNRYTLSDRYHLSALIESRKMGPITSETRRLMHKAQKAWGREFFDQYGWARPVLRIRPTERPTFAHIERYVKMNIHRHLYIEFNNSIHAGALNTVSRTDFRLQYAHFTRADCDPDTTSRILQATLLYLTACTYAIIREVSAETNNWDNNVLIGMLDQKITPLYEEFANRERTE